MAMVKLIVQSPKLFPQPFQEFVILPPKILSAVRQEQRIKANLPSTHAEIKLET